MSTKHHNVTDSHCELTLTANQQIYSTYNKQHWTSYSVAVT